MTDRCAPGVLETNRSVGCSEGQGEFIRGARSDPGALPAGSWQNHIRHGHADGDEDADADAPQAFPPSFPPQTSQSESGLPANGAGSPVLGQTFRVHARARSDAVLSPTRSSGGDMNNCPRDAAEPASESHLSGLPVSTPRS